VAIFPIVAAGVSAIFAVLLFQRYGHRKNPAQLFWGISMAMFALASVFVAFGVAGGWDKTLFKGYWLFGALLNVPFLALGSIALLRNRVLTAVSTLVVAASSLYAIGIVAAAKANEAAIRLHPYDVPVGKDVWGKAATVAKLGTYYSIPAYFVVIVIAALSSRSRDGVRPPSGRVKGNWLIVVGVTIVALGGALARYKRGVLFGVLLALGVVVMFVGFVLASRQAPPQEPASVPAGADADAAPVEGSQ
jgi:hypothetical protein